MGQDTGRDTVSGIAGKSAGMDPALYQDLLSGFFSKVNLVILIENKWYQEGENKNVYGLLKTRGLGRSIPF